MTKVTFTIEKGDHYCSPKVYKLFTGSKFNVSWDITMSSDLTYDLKNEDQYDWNKLTGISLFKLIPNDDNSIRLGYRYIVSHNTFEIAPYYHINGKVSVGKIVQLPPVITSLNVNIKYSYKMSTIVVKSLTDDKTLIAESLGGWPENYKFAYENNFYFGGNQVAPNTLILYKNRL